MITLWHGEDLRFVGNTVRQLASLHLEGVKQLATLEGIEGSINLTELEMRECRISSLEPLRGSTSLRILRLLAGRKSKGEAHLELSDLSALKDLEVLNIIGAGKSNH